MTAFPVTDIQRFTTRDGPGLRDTVFFKGCSLRCRWCHNPEAVLPPPELCFHQRRCVGCGACASACPRGLFPRGVGEYVFNADCVDCGACAQACPVSAIAWASRRMTAEAIIATVLRDEPFYNPGGVTLSGGEPLMQPGLPELLAGLRSRGLHTAVDTALNVPWDAVEAAVPGTALFLVDIKAMDAGLHHELTGSDNRHILDNIRHLAAAGAPMWIRVPVIPGQNDGELNAIAAFVQGLGRPDIPVELIPYHDMASGKYASVGREMPLRGLQPPTAEAMTGYYRLFERIPRVSYTQ